MATIFSTRDLGISPGQTRHDEVDLELVPYNQSGQEYLAVGGSVPARLDTTAMTEGISFQLRFSAVYEGPCSRCLEPASLAVEIDAFEVHDPNISPDEEGAEQLRSEHVDDKLNELNVSTWAQECVGLQFPSRLLCKSDCRGLCGECGIDMNQVDGEHHHDKPADSRWDALKSLQLDDSEGSARDAAEESG